MYLSRWQTKNQHLFSNSVLVYLIFSQIMQNIKQLNRPFAGYENKLEQSLLIFKQYDCYINSIVIPSTKITTDTLVGQAGQNCSGG